MGRKLATVEIQHPRDPRVPLRINKADFDPSQHKLWQPIAPAQSVAPIQSPATRNRDWYLLMSSAGWREVKSEADAIGYHKPEGLSWEDAIPQIIAHEQEVLGSADDQ